MRAFRSELSKAGQLSLMEELELPYPKARVIHRAEQAPAASEAQTEVARITDVKQSARGYSNYRQWIAGSQLEQKVSLEDYSVSSRGLRSGFVGTASRVRERLQEFAAVGVDLVLSSSPQAEEMERFAAEIIQPS